MRTNCKHSVSRFPGTAFSVSPPHQSVDEPLNTANHQTPSADWRYQRTRHVPPLIETVNKANQGPQRQIEIQTGSPSPQTPLPQLIQTEATHPWTRIRPRRAPRRFVGTSRHAPKESPSLMTRMGFELRPRPSGATARRLEVNDVS